MGKSQIINLKSASAYSCGIRSFRCSQIIRVPPFRTQIRRKKNRGKKSYEDVATSCKLSGCEPSWPVTRRGLTSRGNHRGGRITDEHGDIHAMSLETDPSLLRRWVVGRGKAAS